MHERELPEPWAEKQRKDDAIRDKDVELIEATLQAMEEVEHVKHTAHMTDITRPELDAKLEAIEARMDARILRIENAVIGFKDEATTLRVELSHAKWWAIGTAVAVLSIFLANLQWGFSMQKEENARMLSYMREDVRDIASHTEKQADFNREAVNELQLSIKSLENELSKVRLGNEPPPAPANQ